MPPKTRTGSQSNISTSNTSNSLTLENIQELIVDSEKRMLSKFNDMLAEKFSVIEQRLGYVQVEQIRLSQEIECIKDTVTRQQMIIERNEFEKRSKNPIFVGVPENDIACESDEEILETDQEKINYLCCIADDNFDPENNPDSTYVCSRLGRHDRSKTRPIKVSFTNAHTRNQVLFNRKRIWENDNVKKLFRKIYINPDQTYLGRLEGKRLREKMIELKRSSPSPENVYIRSGKLYMDNKVVDQSNIKNQLF